MIKIKINTIIIYVSIYLIFFLITDILFSNFVYKKNIQNNCYIYTENFHYLKKNCHAKEKWLRNSLSYDVYTDHNGFRISGKKSSNNSVNKIATFSGGSFTYGMGLDHKKTYVGLIEKAKEEYEIINLGVPGYSTSAFNYQLKKLINDKIYPKKIFVVLDILDVSNEASLWDHNDEYEHPVRVKKNIINIENTRSLKKFKRNNFKISRLIARSINNFFRSIRLYFSNLEKTRKAGYTPYGSFLYMNIEDTDQNLWEPHGFDQSIAKITKNIEEISKMATTINADFYIIIYPWPDTLEYGQKKFNWEKFANNLCEKVSCTKLINLFPDFRNIKESSNDWVDKLYIKQDLHLREFGQKIVAEKILKVAF